MDEPTCTCNVDYAFSCDVHVSCDRGCGALLDPRTKDELRAAVEHWRRHQYLSGCSHGC